VSAFMMGKLTAQQAVTSTNIKEAFRRMAGVARD
jgi:hypothetical protein